MTGKRVDYKLGGDGADEDAETGVFGVTGSKAVYGKGFAGQEADGVNQGIADAHTKTMRQGNAEGDRPRQDAIFVAIRAALDDGLLPRPHAKSGEYLLAVNTHLLEAGFDPIKSKTLAKYSEQIVNLLPSLKRGR